VRRALIIALVVVMLLTGVPILIGGMGACHDCGPATMSVSGCMVGVLIMVGLLVAMFVTFIRPRRFVCDLQHVSKGLERPPRFV
jgi:hypothetical protein